MARKENVASSRDGFLEGRRHSLGGSECAGLYIGGDCVPEKVYATPLKIWCSKTGREYVDDNKTFNIFMAMGTALEPVVIEAAEDKFGYKITQLTEQLKSPEWPYSHANLDGVLIEERNGKPTITQVIEIKTGARLNKERPYLGHELQLKHNMAVAQSCGTIEHEGRFLDVQIEGGLLVGLDRMDNKPEPFVHQIFWDHEGEGEEMLAFEDAWWRRYVLGDEQPDPVPADLSYLAEYPTREEGKVVECPELEEWARTYRKISEREKQLKEKKEMIKLHLRTTLGDAERGITAQYSISNKSKLLVNERKETKL